MLIATAFCLAANSNSNPRPAFFAKDSVKAEQHAALTQVDFDGYYENLIKTENETINKAAIGFLIGTFATGFGIFTITTAFDNSDCSELVEMNRDILKLTGIGLSVVGITGITYGLYTYFTKTGENSKRASYERAYEIYKRRRAELKDGTKIIVTPTVDPLAAAAGLKMDVAFKKSRKLSVYDTFNY